MRSFIPLLTVRKLATHLDIRPKFGGAPWGLPLTRWPVCRECGETMSFLSQLPVRGSLDRAGLLCDRADLADRVLYIFKCERLSICCFWEPDRGANAAFFIKENELGSGESVAPDLSTPVLPEIWVGDWKPHDDGITSEQAAAFIDHDAFWQLPDEVVTPHGFDHRFATKIGGVPYWTGNGPGKPPQPPFRYLLQIDQYLDVKTMEEPVSFGNFCTDGTGYLFVDVTSSDVPCLFLINR